MIFIAQIIWVIASSISEKSSSETFAKGLQWQQNKQFIYLFWIYFLIYGPPLRFPMLQKRKVTDSSQNYNLALTAMGCSGKCQWKQVATILRKDVSINHFVAYCFLVDFDKIKLNQCFWVQPARIHEYGNKSDAWPSQINNMENHKKIRLANIQAKRH